MVKWISIQPLAGGMAIGAEQAFGSVPTCIIDYEDIANANSKAYVDYMNKTKGYSIPHLVIKGNNESRSEEFIDKYDESLLNDIDAVVAVPRCSGLSQANSCKTGKNARGVDAVQNNNMKGIAEFTIQKIKPKVYIFENAPILFSNSAKPLRDWFETLAKENGYSVTWIKTNTHLHSNVQTRVRTFGIMWKNSKCPMLKQIYQPFGKIVDYLATIDKNASYNTVEYNLMPDIESNGFIKYMRTKYGDNFQKCWPYDKGAKCVTEVIEYNKDFDLAKSVMNPKEAAYIDHVIEKRASGKNYFDASPIYWGDSEISSLFGRTISRMVHPIELRGYTVREALKFMGMPDDYEIEGIMDHLGYIGQNVPVVTARDWCIQIKEFLDGKLKISNESVMMFDNTKAVKTKPLLY